MISKKEIAIFLYILLLIASCKTQKQSQNTTFQVPQDYTLTTPLNTYQKTPEGDTILMERNFIDGCAAKALGDYDKAIYFFKEVLTFNPKNAAALYELGKIYFEYGKMDDAKELSRLATENSPDNEYYLLLYGDILTYMLQYNEAAKIYETIIQKFPTKIDHYLQLSYIYEKSGNYKKCVDVLTQSIQLFGEDENALVQLQRVYVKSNDLENAIVILEKLIQQNPQNPSYYGLLSEVYALSKNSPMADATFEKLLALDPDNEDLLFQKAHKELLNGNLNAYQQTLLKIFQNETSSIDKKIFFLIPFIDSIDSEDFVQKKFIFSLTEILVQKHSDNAKAFALRGDFLYYSNEMLLARTQYQNSLTLRSDVYDVWIKMFYIDADLQQYDSLYKTTSAAIELFPNQPMGYYFNGVSLVETDPEESIKIFKRALPLSSSNPKLKADIYMRTGDVYFALKKYADSDSAYESSLKLNPNNPYALNNYAYHLSVRSESLEKALTMAKHANDLVTNNASLLDTYAWVLYKMKNYTEAKKVQQKAILYGGNKSTVILEHFGDILFRLGEKDKALEYWQQTKLYGEGSEFLDKKISEGIIYE